MPPFRTNLHSGQHSAHTGLAPPCPSTFLTRPDLALAEAKALEKVRPTLGSPPLPQKPWPPTAAKAAGFPVPLFCFAFPTATVALTLSTPEALPFECAPHPFVRRNFWPNLTKQERELPKAKVLRPRQSRSASGQNRSPSPPEVPAANQERHTPAAWSEPEPAPCPTFSRWWALPLPRSLERLARPSHWSVERPKPWAASPRSFRTLSFLDRNKQTLRKAIETRRSGLESSPNPPQSPR